MRTIDRLPLTAIVAALGLAALALYLPHVGHAFLAVDDDRFITGNPLVTDVSASTVLRAFAEPVLYLYLPLTILSYQASALLGGVHPSAFHLTDALLHAINTGLVFLVLRRIAGKRIPAIVAALLFALHPLQTEAVLWASARKDLLSATFCLLSLLDYERYLDGEAPRWRSVLWFLFALLGKISAVTLPGVLLLLDLFHGRRDGRAMLLEKIPYAIVAVPLWVVGVIAAKPFISTVTPWEMLLLGAKQTVFLLGKLVWPSALSIFHLQKTAVGITDPVFLFSLIFFLFLCATVTFSVFKKKVMGVGIGIGWFLLLLLPTFAAAQKSGVLFFASEKYAYLPSVGIFLLAAIGLERLLELQPRLRSASVAVVVIVCAALAWRTSLHARTWSSSETVLRNVLAQDPENAVALSSIGVLRAKEETYEEALAFFRAAIAADPHYIPPSINAATMLRKLDRPDDASAVEISIASNLTERQVLGDPGLRRALQMLVQKFREQGRGEAAEALEGRLVDFY